jgi:aldehyde:ferredoxin oxidoreductase
MYGWMGRIMFVELGSGTVRVEPLPSELATAYLGGRGLGVRLMRDHFRLDPFDADIPLIFAVGPLCGTSAPTSARLSVVSRSPLTGTICDCSVGGKFAWRLKRAGIDALVVTGRSPRPVVLAVTPEGAALMPAEALRGATTGATAAALRDRGSVAAIGPAGERRVLFANIMTGEGNAAGRGGLGAVMGDKGLKAVVVDGDRETQVADPARLEAGRRDAMRLFRASPVIFGELGIAEYGTPALVDLLRVRRMTPTANFRGTHFAGSVNYSGPAIKQRYAPRKEGCYGCPIQCKKSEAVAGHMPEFETVSHFGALNLNDDLESIVAANRFCNEAGMDTISAAASIAALGEIRGEFPDGAAILRLLQATVTGEGDGEQLAQGSSRLAAAAGAPHLAMAVKGQEMPAYDPRGAYGMALAYCTSNRGACHLRAYPMSHEVLRKPVATDRFSLSGKARIIAIAEDTNAAVDSLVACKFAFFGASLEEYGEMVSGATGSELPPQVLKEIGRRICRTERHYNSMNGFGIADDRLPERFFTEAGSSGDGIAVPPLDRQRFDEELAKYYRIRGLDEEGRLLDPDFLEVEP